MSVAPAPNPKTGDAYRIDISDTALRGNKERKNIDDEEEKKEDVVSNEYTAINIGSSDNNNNNNSNINNTAATTTNKSAYVTTDNNNNKNNNVNKTTVKKILDNNTVITNIDAKKGKILQNKAVENAVKPPHVHEEAYVPVSYARQRIADMSGDMVRMKAGFQEKIFRLDEFYRQLENETKNYYKSFIHVINEKATERIKKYKNMLLNANKASEEEKRKQLSQIDGLKNERSLLNIAKEKLVEKMEEEAIALRKHEEMELKKARKHELQLIDEEKTKYVQFLSADANKLSTTQHEMKKVQAALKLEINAMTEEYFKQMEELQNHIVSLKDLQMVEAKYNSAELEHRLDLQQQQLESRMELQMKTQKQHFEQQFQQKSSSSAPLPNQSISSQQQNEGEEVKELDMASSTTSKTDMVILQLREKIKDVKREKKASRGKVKKWLSEFEEKEGRPPTNSEKSVVGDLFKEAKNISSKLKLLEEKLKSLEEKQKLKKNKIDMSPQMASSSSSSSPPPISNAGNTAVVNKELELKTKNLEKLINELKEENDTLKAYKKKSIEDFEKMERDQLAANEKSKKDAEDALASGDVNSLRKQLRESISEQDKINALVTNLQEQIADLKSIVETNENKIKEKNIELDDMTTKYEELKLSKASVSDQATNIASSSSNNNNDNNNDNSELLEQLNNIKNEFEDQKFKYEQSQSDIEALEESVQHEQNKVKELQIEIEKKEIELEIANAKVGTASFSSTTTVENTSSATTTTTTTTTNVHPDEANILQVIKESVSKGKKMWKTGNKQGCYDEYLKTAENVLKQFPDTKECKKFKTLFTTEIRNAKAKSVGPGAILLRKIFKAYQGDAGNRIKNPKTTSSKHEVAKQASAPSGANNAAMKKLEAKLAALEKEKVSHDSKVAAQSKSKPDSSRRSGSGGNNIALNKRIKQLEERSKKAEHRVKELEHELSEAVKHGGNNNKSDHHSNSSSSSSNNKNNQKVVSDLKTKVKTLEKQIKDDKVKLRQMENKLEKAEQAAAKSSGGDSAGKAALERRIKEMEKKHKKALGELENTMKKSVTSLEKKVKKLMKENEELMAELKKVTTDRDALKTKVSSMGAMGKEMETLRAQAAEATDAKKAAKDAIKRQGELQDLYKEEMVLRKRYWNMMEDMKGKIRVYCRTRPLSHSELERGNYVCVKFPDEVTINVETKKGVKEFVFDQCFTPTSTQEEIFEDTSNLINSAFDGFNVCIFAYGQTGAGKSYTMLGALPDNKGITPRAIDRIFELKNEIGNKSTIKCKAYMAELYNDKLVDLLWMAKHKKKDLGKEPKLSIKKDAKGMVFVKGIEIAEANSAEELMELFNTGNGARHVGATKMNAESSRSHLVFSIIIENHDHTTGKTNVGKLTLVDLAGSERVGKTGATKERLKEAQSINTSLSALGDVISALSTGAKFIPYRNNKLTMLLADGLGGNAKTLMFVNLSPADYNADETQTALVYASRVKMITNTAKKESDSEIVAHLKKIVDEFVTTGDSATFKKLGLKPHEEKGD